MRKNAPLMYQLFQYLRDRTLPPTDEEIAIANKSKVLSALHLQEVLSSQRSENIISAFAHQEFKRLVSKVFRLAYHITNDKFFL